jgi:hypothetical protein
MVLLATGCASRKERRDSEYRQALRALAAPVVNGFSDPNGIVYDKKHFRQFVRVYRDRPYIDGAASYEVVTSKGTVKYQGGLDYAYLGQRFRADSLIRFLQSKVKGDKKVHIGKMDREVKKRVRGLSPYAWDICHCVQIVGDARVTEAVPVLNELLRDKSQDIRWAAAVVLKKIKAAQAVRLYSDAEAEEIKGRLGKLKLPLDSGVFWKSLGVDRARLPLSVRGGWNQSWSDETRLSRSYWMRRSGDSGEVIKAEVFRRTKTPEK